MRPLKTLMATLVVVLAASGCDILEVDDDDGGEEFLTSALLGVTFACNGRGTCGLAVRIQRRDCLGV
jgi:hypothetical protein